MSGRWDEWVLIGLVLVEAVIIINLEWTLREARKTKEVVEGEVDRLLKDKLRWMDKWEEEREKVMKMKMEKREGD